uniref:Uncharacterized protein n=8 Tax=Magallana gigas TaxID=29159 RepID=A0A8W8MDK8_MAGGI
MKMSDPDTASTSREDETTLREKDILAIKLLRAIREKKVSEAKKILTENPNIHYRDKTGCQEWTISLHKASSRGHVDVVIHLVANGAQVGSLDWNNHTPFEKAVISRSVNVVEILLMFGAEPNLQDWSWTMEKLGEKEIKIQELITDHVPLVPGYKYEGIQFEVVCAKPNEDITLEKLRLTLCAIDVRNSFIFFCRKMQSEYTELKSLLHEDQTPYSDMFELRTWGATRKTLSLKVIVEGIPKCNEHLFVVSHDRQVGRVDNFIKNEDENTTEVTSTIKMNTKGPTQFAIASVFKKETFAISEDEVVIKPTAEPEAEIDIPKGTFDKAAELQLNVVDTNDVNEDEEDESGPLLMTNVIDMSMSDGQQPKEEIVMKLPIHKKGNEVEEMCVLATSEEDPDDVDDWEVIEAQTDSKGKAAVFKIKHFSIYAGANKKKVLEDKQSITEAIARSIKKERKVEFRLFTRLEQERGKFQFILECWTPKKLKKGGKSRFENDGCEVIDLPAKLYIVDENQTFKLRFKGNCRKVSSENTTKVKEEGNNDDETNEEQNENENEDADSEDNDFVILDFVGKKGYSFTIVDMIVLDTEKPSGKVIIDKEIRTIEMIEQIVSEPSGICKGKGQVVPVENITFHYEDLAEVAFGVKLPPPPKPVREPTDIQIQSLVEEKKLEEFVEKTDAEYPSFVPGMDMKNLKSIGVQLNTEEARIFGKNLGLNNDDIEDFMKLPFGAVFMIRKYRGRRPHYSQKVSIKRALEAIDRHDLVPLIMPEEAEKNTNAVARDVDNGKNDINGTPDDKDVINESDTNVEKSNEEPTAQENSSVKENVQDIEETCVPAQFDEKQNEQFNETVGLENHKNDE